MHVVGIGGSDAGKSAALRARELDPSMDVTVVVADSYPSFSICGIPYYISGEVAHWQDLAHRSYVDLEATGMRLRLDTKAMRIDVAAHLVWLRNPDGGEGLLTYDRLVVGTGRSRCGRRSTAWLAPVRWARLTGCTCCTPWATRSPCRARSTSKAPRLA